MFWIILMLIVLDNFGNIDVKIDIQFIHTQVLMILR